MSSGTDSISPNIIDLSNDEHILPYSPIDRYSTSIERKLIRTIHQQILFLPTLIMTLNKTCHYYCRRDEIYSNYFISIHMNTNRMKSQR